MTATTALDGRLAALHAAGLDRRYDDVLEAEHATGADADTMRRGGHYDYGAQQWRGGHDHAHVADERLGLPLLFCGADRATCYGGTASDADDGCRDAGQHGGPEAFYGARTVCRSHAIARRIY